MSTYLLMDTLGCLILAGFVGTYAYHVTRWLVWLWNGART